MQDISAEMRAFLASTEDQREGYDEFMAEVREHFEEEHNVQFTNVVMRFQAIWSEMDQKCANSHPFILGIIPPMVGGLLSNMAAQTSVEETEAFLKAFCSQIASQFHDALVELNLIPGSTQH